MQSQSNHDRLEEMAAAAQRDADNAQRRLVVLEQITAAMAEIEKSGVSTIFEFEDGVALISVLVDPAGPTSHGNAAEIVPEKVPAPPDQSAEAAPASMPVQERRSGPFSTAEDETLKKLASEGLSVREIAKHMRRAPQGVGGRIRYLNDRATGLVAKAVGKPTADARGPTTPTRCAVSEDDMSNGMSAAEREVRRRARRLGYPEPWSPAKDLALVTALLQGKKLPNAANSLGVSVEVAQQRWAALCPDSSRTWEGQKATVNTLKKLASEAVQ